MKLVLAFALAMSAFAQGKLTELPAIDPPPVAAPEHSDGAFIGAFKQGAGPVSSTVGGFAGYSFDKNLVGFTPYTAGMWTQRGSMVTAGVLKQIYAIGKVSAFCTATAGVASEVTSGLAGTVGCFGTYQIRPKIDVGAGAAVFGANVSGYDFGGRRVVPGFFVRFRR